MKIDKVITSYRELSDDGLAVLAGKIVGAMTDNAYFPDPSPSLSELTLLLEDYRQKHEIAVNGGSLLDKRLKRESRKALLKSLRLLAYHVNIVADGNLPALTSSGMILAKQPGRTYEPDIVRGLLLKDGNLSGQINVSFVAQKDVWDYEIQVGVIPDGETSVVWGESYTTSNSRGNILAPMTPGTNYYIRVRARNRQGIGDWSEPASLIAR